MNWLKKYSLRENEMKPELKEQILQCNREIKEVDKIYNGLGALNKTRSYLTNYALIKTCGTIEFVYRAIIADFFDQFQVPQINTYLEKNLRSGSRSALYENMHKSLKEFDAEWASNFQSLVDQEGDKGRIIQSVKSLVTNRHNFAHGKNSTVTFGDIKQYYCDGLVLISKIDIVINNVTEDDVNEYVTVVFDEDEEIEE